MPLKHRNSQKRIHMTNTSYFLTTKTQNNFPYFEEKIFCDVFIKNLKLCKQLKQFKLYGWVLSYDHFHLLIEPNDKFNISKIMKSLKENVSYMINKIIKSEGTTLTSRLQRINDNYFNLTNSQTRFLQKYPKTNPFHEFKWQKSFHDHYIRNENDFNNHIKYIYDNLDKHNMPKNWSYIFTNPKYKDVTDESI